MHKQPTRSWIIAARPLISMTAFLSLSTSAWADSQILAARNATLIVVGEVVYIAKPLPIVTFAAHLNSQIIVFRVDNVLKGACRDEFVRVKYRFGYDEAGVDRRFQKGSRFVLLLGQLEDPSNCYEAERGSDLKDIVYPNPEFLKYKKVPCYLSLLHEPIRATEDEVAAVQWLVQR